jgi:hypothetical protein
VQHQRNLVKEEIERLQENEVRRAEYAVKEAAGAFLATAPGG